MSRCMHTANVTCPNCAWQRGKYLFWQHESLPVDALPVPQLTEADVRRIVREELARTPPQGQGEAET